MGYTKKIVKRKDFGFKSLRLGRKLKEGYVLTIEPGIYIIPELIQLRKSEGAYMDFVNYDKLETIKDFGGIRLEDDFVITREGSEKIGSDIPTSFSEIESFRKESLE